MSKISAPVNPASARRAIPSQDPSEDAVRDYAYHLYQQSSCAPGHDVDNWLEATACLKANIPAHFSHSRLHQHVKGSGNG
jgi:hypothetical protein